MRKPTKAKLLETVSDIVPVPVPAMGDNAAAYGEAMPTREATHRSIEDTLAVIVTNENAIAYARQKLAHLFNERHDHLVADKPAGSVPFAHEMAVNPKLYQDYLTALVAEFTVADPEKLKDQNKLQRESYARRLRARLDRGLRLFVNLSWFRTYRPELMCKWDADNGRWFVSPLAFVPPTYMAGANLLKEADGTTDKAGVYMESVDAAEHYFVSRGRGAPIDVNLSLDQFNETIAWHIKVLRDPNVDTSTIEATPARGRRAARQAAAAADTAAADADIAATDSDTPEADAPSAQTDRVWALGQAEKLLIATEKMLNHDTLANVSWSDWTKEGHNAITGILMVIDRMNAKPDGKVKSKPAKLAA